MNIVLYTIGCPKCKILETKLKAKNVEFDICEDIEIMKTKNFMSAPMLEVDDIIYNFSEAIKWVNGLECNEV